MDRHNKRHEYDKKTRNSENDVPTEKQKTVYILGDSKVKKLNGVSPHEKYKFLVKIRPKCAKVSWMVDHLKPAIRNDKPDHAIVHTGTNDLDSEKTVSHIA